VSTARVWLSRSVICFVGSSRHVASSFISVFRATAVATDRPTDTCRPAASAAAAATAAAAGTESLSPPAARVARPTDAETSRGAPPAAAALAGQSDLDHRVMRILPAALRRTNHAGPSLRRSVRMRLFQSAGSRLV